MLLDSHLIEHSRNSEIEELGNLFRLMMESVSGRHQHRDCSGHALAYTGLSDSYALHVDYRNVPVFEGFARAKDYARKALELDDSLAEAHTSLAWCLFIIGWD